MVVDVIRESKSAKEDGNRPLFTQMLKRVEAKKVGGILAVDTDRLSRNFIEAGMLIKLIEKQILFEVRTPTQTYQNSQSLL